MMLSPPLVVLLVVLLPPSAFAMLIAKATVPLSGMASVPRIYGEREREREREIPRADVIILYHHNIG